MSKRSLHRHLGLHHRPVRQQSIRFRHGLRQAEGTRFRRRRTGRLPAASESRQPERPERRLARRDAGEVAARGAEGQDGGQGPRLLWYGRQPVGREADQHRRPDQVHRGVPQELGVLARPRHPGHPRRHACSRRRFFARSTTTRPCSAWSKTWKDVLRHRRRQRPVRDLGIRAGLRLQQADRHRCASTTRSTSPTSACSTTPATARWWA